MVDLCATTVTDDERGTVVAKSNEFSALRCLAHVLCMSSTIATSFLDHETWSNHGLTISYTLARHQATDASSQFRLAISQHQREPNHDQKLRTIMAKRDFSQVDLGGVNLSLIRPSRHGSRYSLSKDKAKGYLHCLRL